MQEYFEGHPEKLTANPCELMPLLLQKGIFYKRDQEGSQLSYFLCKLETMGSIIKDNYQPQYFVLENMDQLAQAVTEMVTILQN